MKLNKIINYTLKTVGAIKICIKKINKKSGFGSLQLESQISLCILAFSFEEPIGVIKMRITLLNR